MAISWVGSVLFVGWGVFPATKTLPVRARQTFLLALMRRSHLPFSLAGLGVIITGVLLGTIFGPVHHWHDIWQTRYGRIWVSALIIALITLFWGVFIGFRRSIKVLSNPVLWKTAEAGYEGPLKQALFTVAATESVEIIGFMILIGLMISF